MKKLLLFILLVVPLFGMAQFKNDFEQQRQMDLEKVTFRAKLITIDSLCKKGLNFGKLDSLKQTGRFDFITYKTKPSGKQLVFDLPQYLATDYLKFEKTGAIPNLQKLRAAGKLNVPSREVASDVELPRKTDPHQSYNDFYLQVIQQLIKKHRAELAADNFTYTVYQQWEAEQHLKNDAAVTEFRASMIRALYSHYHFSS